MINDAIGDMLIRIKNGYLAKKEVVCAPYSVIKEKIGLILVKEGYLREVKVKADKASPARKQLELYLKYNGRISAITGVKRISKPGIRNYVPSAKIPRVKLGFGITIVSTSKGLMIDKQARKQNLGGEVLCQIW